MKTLKKILLIWVKNAERVGVSRVIISSVLVKYNIKLTKFIRQLNDIYEKFEKFMFSKWLNFISNDNITRDFICQDDVRLNKDTLHKKCSFLLNISSVNVTKSVGN